MRRSIVLVCAVLLAPVLATAQASLEAKQEHMEAVAFMVGNWSGEGWIVTGPGGPQKFSSHETIEAKLDGLVLTIDGVHTSLEENNLGQPVHHAFAVLSWDDTVGAYSFQSHLADGRSGDFKGHFADGAFVWGMEIPDRSIRYTITIDDQGRWTEIGASATDGQTWQKFFEMTLQRVE
jgi:hypothetical protein